MDSSTAATAERPITEIVLKVTNKKGVHARAAAKFVKILAPFNANVMVAKILGPGDAPVTDDHEVSATSILGLMMLGAECNSTIRLRISGDESAQAAEAITKLVESKFGEDE